MSENYGYSATYDGQYFDSQTEAAWAAYFDAAGMPFEHEPETFELRSGEWYTPDFFLPEQDTYVEVKNGNANWDACSKFAYFIRSVGKTGLMLNGKPHNMAAYFFSPDSTNTTSSMTPYPANKYADFTLNKPRDFRLPPAVHPRTAISVEIMGYAKAAQSGISTDYDPALRNASKARKRQMQKNRTVLA